MSSNNNSELFGFAIVGAIIGVTMMLMFALAAFVALIFTVLAICAWNSPLTLFGETIYPEDARAFVYRGLAGMVIVPVFAAFCTVLFDFPIKEGTWIYLVLGGYAFGSVILEIDIQEERQKQRAQARDVQEVLPALPPQEKPDIKPAQPRASEPFPSASWNDDEEIRP